MGDAPFPVYAAVAAVNAGRDDDIRGTVGSKISAASFVDNTIHHAVYEKSIDTLTGRHLSLSRPKSSDFQVTLGKQYDFSEANASVLLTHTEAQGVNSESPVFYNDSKLLTGATAPIMLFGGNDTILPESVTTGAKNTEVTLRNMKGEDLATLGLESSVSSFLGGQTVNVGLRTSDIVMRLFRDKTHSINSISVGRPYAGPRLGTSTTNKGSSLFNHSMNFLSRDFRSLNIPNAARFVARHDGYALYMDRFGNFIYANNGFSQTDRTVENLLANNVISDPIRDAANRVVVRGKSIALNNDNEAHVDDVEMQKKDGVVKSVEHIDPTANTRFAARQSANRILKMNRRAQQSITSKDHIQAWDLQPGDVIDYVPYDSKQSIRTAVIEIEHSMSNAQSSLHLLAYELGIEDVVNKNVVTDETLNEEAAVTFDNQIAKLEMSSVGKTNINIRGILKHRVVSTSLPRVHSSVSGITLSNAGEERHSGFMIGHRHNDMMNYSGRSAIGTGLTLRLSGGTSDMSAGIIGVSSTTGFPSSGHLIIEDDSASLSVQVSYGGKTSTTFTEVRMVAPIGASISTSGLRVRLHRTRGHEMRNIKSTPIRRAF